jgi:hypothetical protein
MYVHVSVDFYYVRRLTSQKLNFETTPTLTLCTPSPRTANQSIIQPHARGCETPEICVAEVRLSRQTDGLFGRPRNRV